ncbi:triosephosphate isomerase, partial [Marasmius crinis-equi]
MNPITREAKRTLINALNEADIDPSAEVVIAPPHLYLIPTKEIIRKEVKVPLCSVVGDIIKHFQLQTTEDPTTQDRSAKKAHATHCRVEIFKREDALLVVANIVKTIGDAPGLAPVKLAGGLLGQIGDLVKIIKLQQEKGWRRAKEELASLRKELERAQLTFVTRSIVAVRLELPAQLSNPVKTEMQSGPAKIV